MLNLNDEIMAFIFVCLRETLTLKISDL